MRTLVSALVLIIGMGGLQAATYRVPGKPGAPKAVKQLTATERQRSADMAGLQAMISASRQKEWIFSVGYWSAEQAEIVVTNHILDLGGMWFRTWRTEGVSNRYLMVADELEKLSKMALGEYRDTEAHRDLARWSTSYREVAHFIVLGAKDGDKPIDDGSGTYTRKIRDLLSTTAQEVAAKKARYQDLQAQQADTTAKLGQRLFDLTNPLPTGPAPK